MTEEQRQPDHRGWRELAFVALGFAALTVALTSPLAFRLGGLARLENADGQFAIWNVAWVARTLVVDALHVFDANIFYPHRWTLAYSEANLGSGLLAVPVYWATRNPYAAHNFVLLLSFVLSAAAAYYLAFYLARDRRAAAVAAICFAFCPYVFAHLPHIQLLMTAGLPLTLLAFHRLADQPSPGRGVVLGLAIGAQALMCAYYTVFVALMLAYAVLFVAVARRRWNDARYWSAIAAAVGVSAAAVLPLFLPYLMLQREIGLGRSLEAARQYSAQWRAYFGSVAYAHAWMLPLIRGRGEVEMLFPGFVATGFGIAGMVIAWRAQGRLRETAVLYASLAGLALWASFGPGAGLYRVLYIAVPGFAFMRAPSRFGVVVVLALSVLAAIAIARLLAALSRPTLAAAALVIVAAAGSAAPLRFHPVPPVHPAYTVLADRPYGAVIEMPVFSRRFAFLRAQYMLNSTAHWKPLVNAYSDHIPEDFAASVDVLGQFPSVESFKLLERQQVRYAVFHLDLYGGNLLDGLTVRLNEFAPYLRLLYGDGRIQLYEIAGYPP
jgi:hypothetical protein